MSSIVSRLGNALVVVGPKNKDAFCSGYRSPSSVSAIEGEGMSGRGLGGLSNSGSGYGYKELRRTPSTSAIYETLRRSKELRESLTRPSSRLSMDEKMRDSVSPVGYVMKVRRLTLMHPDCTQCGLYYKDSTSY